MKKAIALAAVIMVGLIFSSCGAGQSEASKSTVFENGAYVFEDSVGNTVMLDEKPQAVLAANSDLLYLWRLSGGEGSVISSADDMLQCDFLILSPDDDELLSKALSCGVCTGVFYPYELDGYLKTLKAFTDINDRAELYTYYGSDMADLIDETIETCAGQEQKNVCLVDEKGNEAEDSFITDILKDLANYTPESEADVVFVLPGGGSELFSGERYVVLIDELFEAYPMERLAEAYGYIAAQLYELN
ncbi:MAG: hypothetical protein LUH82_04870 [Clostridiales bacterium]|nr:hypothetical protein [Clostridiales bacterium]